MRLSVSLPKPGVREGDRLAEALDLAQCVERCGLHAVSGTDHPFPRTEGTVSHHAHDPFVLLAYLAASTERIRLHFSLLVAGHRSPYLTAKMLSTLDLVSAGRVLAALGAGYHEPELAALGAPADARGRRAQEVVEMMRVAWSGEPVYREHAQWPAEGNQMFPRPVQGPHPPLWRGGNTKAAMRSVARAFDGWSPMEASEPWAGQAGTSALTMRTIGEAVDQLREAWVSADRIGVPDVCLVRGRQDWLADEDRLVAEVGQLEGVGVTWVEINVAGRAPQEGLERVERVAAALRSAGLLATS